MNSLRSLGRAIEYEISRQVDALEAGERIVQETRHWNEEDGRTHSMRTKEGSSDYRYFPEPDLVPIAPTDEMRATVRESLPELPAARRARLVEAWGIPDTDARVLVGAAGLAEYAEAAVDALRAGTPKDVVNWCIGDVLAFVNETGLSPVVLPLAPDGLAELVGLVAAGTLSRGQAKDVLDECLREPKRPKQVVEERGLAQVSDEGELGAVVDAVLAENPTVVAEFHSAAADVRTKKLQFLMGQAMRALKGQGNPLVLKSLLEQRLGGN
jgi:aspartyl-tRNA(Asn)/glutamyl-tRNA(Gln) amidotransferase subunit B